MDSLLDPPFAKDPPLKLDIPARTLGLVCAILGGIGTFFGVLGLLGLSAFAAVAGLSALVPIGILVGVIGTAVSAWGGYRMYQGDRDGKRLVIYGLVANSIGNLVAGLVTGGIANWIVNTAFLFVIYYLVVISRFEGEPKLVGSTSQPPVDRSGGPPAP